MGDKAAILIVTGKVAPFYHEHMLKLLLALTALCALPAQTLDGVVDIHAHCDPDSLARSIDAIDLAKLARDHGMRALVLKNHYEPASRSRFWSGK